MYHESFSGTLWLNEFNSYFCKIENFAYGEINEWIFSNHHPGPQVVSYYSTFGLI